MSCPSGKKFQSGLCYTPCKNGYEDNDRLPRCFVQCPSGSYMRSSDIDPKEMVCHPQKGINYPRTGYASQELCENSGNTASRKYM